MCADDGGLHIICDPDFIGLQLSCSNSSLIFKANDQQEKDFIDTISFKINRGPWSSNTASVLNKQRASCNGLLLILLCKDGLRVGNPITHQWLKLPEIGLDFARWLTVTAFAFIYDHNGKVNIVVCSHTLNRRNLFSCVIHIHGKRLRCLVIM